MPYLVPILQLLQLLIHLQERGESDAAKQAQEEEEEESMSGGVSTADTTPLWGSPPSRKQAPPVTEDVYAQECRRKRPDAPSGKAGRAGRSITVGASDPLDDTPRKMRRLQALRNARFNQTGELLYSLACV
jgi:hypothetical protein